MDRLKSKAASNHFVVLLCNRPFLYFSLSVFASQIAFNMLTIVLIFLVFFLTNSNFSVSILLFMLLIPQIFISFLGGVIADVADRKMIFLVGNLLRAAVLLLLFFNSQSVFVVYFVTFLVSTITQFYVPAESSVIPSLVDHDQLVAANSIFGISFFGSVLIGYVLAGPIVTALGRSNIFLVLAILFVIAAVFAHFIPKQKIKKEDVSFDFNLIRRSIRSELHESYTVIRHTPRVGNAFLLLIFSQIVIFILATLIPGYAKTIIHVPAEDLSLVLFAPAAIGMVIAGLLIGGVFHKSEKEKLMSIGVFMSGAVLCLLPATSQIFSQSIVGTMNLFMPKLLNLNVFNFVLLLAFFAGVANALIFIPSQAIIQEAVPEAYRSKIYGLLFSLIGVFSLLPIIVAGGVADLIGVGSVLFLIGLLIIIIGAIREKILISVLHFIRSR